MSIFSPENQNDNLKDYGPEPIVFNIQEATVQNNYYRYTLWTGEHLQLVFMDIEIGETVSLHVHPDSDMFIYVEDGKGLFLVGERRDKLDNQIIMQNHFAYIVPAGKWHSIVNTGIIPFKVYVLYSQPALPYATFETYEGYSDISGS